LEYIIIKFNYILICGKWIIKYFIFVTIDTLDTIIALKSNVVNEVSSPTWHQYNNICMLLSNTNDLPTV